MKISVYLRSRSVITCESKTSPELIVSQMSGKLLSYKLTDITGNIQPLFIDPQEIIAVVADISNSEKGLCG